MKKILNKIVNLIKPSDEKLPYYTKKSFFNDTEAELMLLLEDVFRDRCYIFAKPRLIDVFGIPRSAFKFKNKIIQKHVDFLLCTKPYFKPVCWIELDWYSHKYKSERDEFVDKVFWDADLQLIRITTDELKNRGILINRINSIIN